ncbi:YchJ family protein [Formosa sp. PL04]|uniref:YchJ family protein n=1 Tax=Formosa sp. PL04 TaxID=3081755 RepID=UPI0029814EB2|nr:YchJ family metal-binding protein [Formosa sp. PL04]MDW5288318.1 YchJ family metal-binding protein [Formosa sp. PL04]
MKCPCCSEKLYKDCCEIAHTDIMQVKTAEALMRSRYSAFVFANGDYLMQSHHKSTRPIKEKKEIVKWAKSVDWIKLDVIKRTKGLEKDTEGTVEFKAIFQEDGELQMIHENSRFLKENGCWFYVDAL